jgi:hypothetical protein
MAGTTANLNNVGDNFDAGNDGIVIVKNLEVVPGGKTLDTTGFTPEVILEGHLLIEETATGFIKPMPVSGTAYAALPGGHTYYGVVVSSVRTSKPFVSSLVRGSVNHKAAQYDATTILAAVKSALPLIRFIQD